MTFQQRTSRGLFETSKGPPIGVGGEDTTVLPSMAGRTLALCPGATASWYDGVGHMAFWRCRTASTTNSPGWHAMEP